MKVANHVDVVVHVDVVDHLGVKVHVVRSCTHINEHCGACTHCCADGWCSACACPEGQMHLRLDIFAHLHNIANVHVDIIAYTHVMVRAHNEVHTAAHAQIVHVIVHYTHIIVTRM